jgi:hypothetical protein
VTRLEMQLHTVLRGSRPLKYSQIQEVLKTEFDLDLSIKEVHELATNMESKGLIRRAPNFYAVD